MRSVVIRLFLLAVATYASASVPVIFQALDLVKPDETLLLFGADIGSAATAEGLRLPDKTVSSPPTILAMEPVGRAENLQVLQASDLSAKVLIPANWKPGVFAVRLRNADGSGEWQFANRPQLWWQISEDGGRASPGGELRVFGKNLGEKSRLWLVNTKGLAQEMPVKIAREFDVAAELPKDLATGSYRVWLHNGFGGQAGFGEPLTLEVDTLIPWPTRIFDVTQYGATHDGQSDDTEAIRQALKKAGDNGGGVVYLPAGTYIVTGKLVVPAKTILRGEKRESVWIKVPIFWPKSPQKLTELDSVVAGNGDFGVENLSIVAQPARRIIAAPDLAPVYGPGMARLPATLPTADRVHLRNLRIQHLYFGHRVAEGDPRRNISEGPATIVVNGADFSLENSEVISAGMPVQIQAAKRARIIRNVLRTGRNGWYGIWNFSQGVFEENDIAGADLEGSYGGVQGSAIELLFRGNHWHDAYGDECEALTFDTPYYPAWVGNVAVSDTALTFQTPPNSGWPPVLSDPRDWFAMVTGGRGIGQAIPVARVTGKGVVLDYPFQVIPDANSTIVIGVRKSRVIISGNFVEGASVAFQLYAQAHEFIITGNRSVRTGGSYTLAYDFLDSAGRHRYSYSLFNQWRDNVFEEGLVYEQGPWAFGFIGIDSAGSLGSKDSIPAVGNRFIGNRLDKGTKIGVRSSASHAGMAGHVFPVGVDTIFEANEALGQSAGILQLQIFSRTLLRKNKFPDASYPGTNKTSGDSVIIANPQETGRSYESAGKNR